MSAGEAAEIVAEFERYALPIERFGHREHVLVAWHYLRDAPFAEGAPRFAAALRRYIAAHGKAAGYHETVTWAFLSLIGERLQAPGAAALDFDAFAERFPELLDRRLLARHYPAETLGSELSRRTFLLPPAAR
jgi:hypothetical protein